MSTTTMISTETAATMAMPLKSSYTNGHGPSSTPSTSTTPSAVPQSLRSLYQRAARAFIQKDISLTYSLMESAFAMLHPPSITIPDALDSQRRKWDILRITLESTVYCSSTTTNASSKTLPTLLRDNMMLAKPILVNEMHTRSMQLFSPAGLRHRAAYLPAQIVTTLALASFKLDCVELSRNMIEDWLAQRDQVEHVREDATGYEKVLDLYCLHVLPSLRAWDYAHDFLEYEEELPSTSRQRLRRALADQKRKYMEELQNRSKAQRPDGPSVPSSSSQSTPNRSPSPSPSTSSSSSADTTSTRTVVPRTARANIGKPSVVGALTPSSGASSSIPNGSASQANGGAVHALSPASATSKDKGKSPAGQPNSNPRSAGTSRLNTSHARDRSRDSNAILSPDRPRVDTVTYTDVFSLLKTYLRPHLTTNKLVFVLLLILFPILSFVLRGRRKRALGLAGSAASAGAGAANALVRPSGNRSSTASGPPSAVNEARRRLRASGPGSGVLSSAWREIYRSVSDAVRMAGGGLV